MGLGLWFFQRQRDGTFKQVPHTHMRRFLDGVDRLVADDDGFAYLVEIVVGLENRKPTNVRHLLFMKEKVMRSGKIDAKHAREALRAVVSSITYGLEKPKAEGMIEAGHRFASRRRKAMSHWQPSEKESEALAAALRQRMSR